MYIFFVSDKELFYNLRKHIENHKYIVDVNKLDLEKIKNLLDRQKNFFITLITNENLTEHETFTEMIMSIMHLREELDSRYSNDMEKYEYNHIGVDISVSYKYLTIEWLAYMHYLKDNYPQLFLKALINNPFDKRSKKEKDAIYLNKIG